MPDTLALMRAQRASCRSIDDYWRMMQREYTALEPFLPAQCEAWADIGCGIGGLSFLLAGRYTDAVVLLIDRDEVAARPRYGYSDREEYYNSLTTAAKLLSARVRVRTQRAHGGLIDAPSGSLDLVLSTYACGFHFPYDTYREAILRTLSPLGVLVLDARLGIDHGPLHLDFPHQQVVETDHKRTRLCLSRIPTVAKPLPCV